MGDRKRRYEVVSRITKEEFRDIRKGIGWSQRTLAENLGVVEHTVQEKESGRLAITVRDELAMRWLRSRERGVL